MRLRQRLTRSHIITIVTFLRLTACGPSSVADGAASQENPTSATTATSTVPVAAATPGSTDSNTTGSANTGDGQTGSITVVATGFTPHAGQNFFAAVVDANNHRLADTNLVVPASGDFNLTFDNVALDGNDRLVYFADVNKNGFCNTPPLDHAWSVSVPAGTTHLSIAHNENFTPVCESFGNYNVTFTGTGFTPHIGQTFYIDVVDNKDKTEVGQIQQMVVPSTGATAAAWGPLLLAGHSYTVAYFADVNKNQTCDNLGTDHAWEKTLTNVSADAQVMGKHSDTQVKSVCTDFPTGKLP